MTEYVDSSVISGDGLSIYARDYFHPGSRLPLLCMHGLTRNSADFEPLAALLSPEYRMLIPEQRGRGRSGYDPNPANYNPLVYCADMFQLLDKLGLDKVVVIGTSMGGLMAMMMAAMKPGRIAAIVLNDIGPELDRAGLVRIKTYVGKSGPVSNWEEAAAQARGINQSAFPDYTDADWLDFARRTYVEDAQGVPRLAYDPAISQPIAANESNAVPPDLWPLFDSIATLPMLLLRGELSDLLSSQTVAEMKRRKPDLETVDVPRRGHAPILDEAEAIAAIRSFLSLHA